MDKCGRTLTLTLTQEPLSCKFLIINHYCYCARGNGRIPALGWVRIVDRIRGGLCEFRAFDGRLGTVVVLHVGEKRRVVFVATGLLDRVSRRVLTPAFASRELPLDLLSGSAVSHFLYLLDISRPVQGTPCCAANRWPKVG